MSDYPRCPRCESENTYSDGMLYICPDCAHEWSMHEEETEEQAEAGVRDANGNLLADGDTVVVIKDLKVKGSSSPLKVGTKIKNIRLVDGDHEVDCKTDLGNLMLKACYLRKA
ncbi:alkylphosphonate utilization protein [Marichromatium gracile]|uniref:Alkylphosphonate utilization protein n=2 Tax=Marichromatium TaxID=85076 RepID=W0E5F9_MARPU|nr:MULTISPECIES: zinc ribbon domain-containing protein YjdM [Marichromatium]MBO8085042.1 alkylphosphonate utilization protein [Marichromatium sp.]AHF04286.1 alkylphosphonate utilization protein [Marichromatium purpuratum 984]KXX63506.1 alkylphosphonate utilization protein [Marichromatium gracile]MBK1708481.1 alkylphosphonate utilization protein [Marichromatium gracile]MCF1184901.1 alkylphosphonate utilization protein [Marichromatium gracile]